MSALILMQLNRIPGRDSFELVPWLTGLWPTLAAGCVLLIVGWLLLRWVSEMLADNDSEVAERQMWSAVNGLRAEGGLTDEELRLIRGRLAVRPGDAARTGLRPDKSAETARLSGCVPRNELQRDLTGSPEICPESSAESIQSAQTSKPTKIRGSALNPDEVSEEP